MRKTIQISMQLDEAGRYFVLALCDDGTIWQLDGLYEGNKHWIPFPVPPWHKDDGGKTSFTMPAPVL